MIPRFVQFLQRGDLPQLQFEAAWALTNVASGTSEHTRVVIDAGAVPIFVQLLHSPIDDVREQAVWALGNIAGDSPKCRDLVLGHGALVPLMEQLKVGALGGGGSQGQGQAARRLRRGLLAGCSARRCSRLGPPLTCCPSPAAAAPSLMPACFACCALQQDSTKMSMLRNATWTLSNFCRGKPQPDFQQVRRCRCRCRTLRVCPAAGARAGPAPARRGAAAWGSPQAGVPPHARLHRPPALPPGRSRRRCPRWRA